MNLENMTAEEKEILRKQLLEEEKQRWMLIKILLMKL